ncbi:MAG: bifunctional 5,10-methylenetetrahydrofolate dehydrogenase/5,10-methenyltetrahydrofolate cyclohydrolase [Candidatus Paceibacterota bacterium]|jgi:methylenetetrahydrofolate dehydrogenase (NADP+)/methenyltetrahydrofolate cyclohydrolase
MAKILYGAPVKEKIKAELIERIKKLKKTPVLAIVQVGDREDSNVYIRQKQKFGEEIGVKIQYVKITPSERYQKDEEVILKEIKKLNEDENINGIIVQLPLPENIDTQKIINLVDIKKDADGLSSLSILMPATARGVMALLDFYKIETKGKKIAVVGQGILAGQPIGNELEKRGAEVCRCDILTSNIPEIARDCDILISAVGKADLITKEFVNKEQVVIDVGINRTSPPAPLLDAGEGRNEKSQLVGDVNFAEVEPRVSAITPVPGGVGPLTVVCLFQNLIDLSE